MILMYLICSFIEITLRISDATLFGPLDEKEAIICANLSFNSVVLNMLALGLMYIY